MSRITVTEYSRLQDAQPPSRLLLALELRAVPEFAMMFATLPLLMASTPRGDGHPVLVLPGLITTDRATLALRSFLKSRNYAAVGWELGRNVGPLPGIEEAMVERLSRLHAEHGRKVSLVGWSLGGIYARQLAKALPDHVRQVITLGSPFNGDPRATNAWQLYERLSGRRVDDRDGHIGGPLETPPPVPTTAIFSRTDGICNWRNCMERESETAENIEIDSSHCGLGVNPAALYAIADRLAQPEREWKKFDRGGARGFFFHDPARA